MAKLLIIGDTIATKDTCKYFEEKRVEEIITPSLLSSFKHYDYITANLECVLTNKETQIIKRGPGLKTSPSIVNGLSQMGINLVTLANNHTLDYGYDGLVDTEKALDEQGIKHIGICSKDDYSNNYHIENIKGIKVGFYSLAETEFSDYRDFEKGANIMELDRNLDEIKKAKTQCDFLIVYFHGGRELYRYPLPFQVKALRKMVDAGADFIVSQHSHCVGCYEVYKGKTIVYGQGNFTFFKSDNEGYQTSLLIGLNINEDLSYSLEYIPLEKDEEKLRVSENSSILKGYEDRSNELKCVGADELFFTKIIEPNCYLIYTLFRKKIRYMEMDRIFFKRRLLKRLIRKNQGYLLMLLNTLNCESHFETMNELLKYHTGIKNKGREPTWK